MLLKYPQSEEAEVNLTLANTITEVDNFGSNQNDLVYRSQVQFAYSQNGDYDSTIMSFINYLISLPDSAVEGDERSLADSFFEDMESIFKKLKDEEETRKMNSFNISNPASLSSM